MSRNLPLFVLILCASVTRVWSQTAPAVGALDRMPVKEITVFKDGHALVMHAGSMATDPAGDVTMDYLPNPVLGTFWPYSSDKNAKLVSTVASQRRVNISRTALSLRELIEANIGAEVTISELPVPTSEKTGPLTYEATILSIPEQSADELRATDPPDSPDKLPQKGAVVLLKTQAGAKVVAFDRILDVTFKKEPNAKLAREEFRNLLTLKLDWGGAKPNANVDVGMLYVQKGIRWIPNYKISIDGEGTATVRLQATLLNELTDLNDVTANLVIGVPTFAFKETADPIGLQQVIAQLSPYFQANAQTAYALSNGIMTQAGAAGRMGERVAPEQQQQAVPPRDLGPELTSTGKTEDLFVFTVKHITLKKGQRMVVPVTEFKVPYRDIYTLDIPFAPPPEVMREFQNQRQQEVTKLFTAPKAIHKIRLTNKSSFPLTTAPALILRGESLLAQGMMTYTAIGSESDLEVTTAVNIRVSKKEQEVKRTPDAAHFDGNSFFRIDLKGSIVLTNFSDKPAEIEVTRHIFGETDTADHDGKTHSISALEDMDDFTPAQYPTWWSWYSWPYWWRHFNPVGRITWTVTLEPNKPTDLNYAWHYYWR